MKRNTRTWLALPVVVAMLAGSPVAAQEFGQVAEQFRNSLEQLRGYRWTAKVQFFVDGQLKSTRVFEVSYDAERRIARKLLSEERKGKVTKSESAAELELSSVRSLIDGYTHMKPEAFQSAFGREPRSVTPEEGTGLTRVVANNFLHRGDTVSMWVDQDDYRMRRLQLDTAMQQKPVYVVAHFEDLETGPTVAVRSVLRMIHKKKSVTLETENSEFVRSGP